MDSNLLEAIYQQNSWLRSLSQRVRIVEQDEHIPSEDQPPLAVPVSRHPVDDLTAGSR
jgi:hypothetical protein